jgi:2-succinyl-6-hydroxy-2,4-cyclohexadiene-1-carboxylate synthase
LEANVKDLRVNVDGIELQVREYERDGEAIIFLHFSGANLMMWQRAVPYFQDQYRLVLVDVRGHGKSDRPETGYHIDEMARDVVGVMDHLGLERAHIIGCSLGAEVGLALAANHPERVLSLASEGALYSEYGPYGVFDGPEEAYKANIAERMEQVKDFPDPIFPSADAVVEASRETAEKYGWWSEAYEAVKRYGTVQVGEGQYKNAWGKPAMEVYMSHYLKYRFEDYYKRVKCPLLILPDEEDAEHPRMRAAMEGFKELAEQGEIVVVSGWVHPFGWLQDPGKMCETILKFIAKAG